jgi:hypothetical protein
MTELRDELGAAVVLRSELIADGFTDRQIASRVSAGELHRVRHGAYVDGPFWAGLSAEDRHRLTVRAVLRRAHPGSVATHVSAAIERRAPVWGIPLDQVHLTRLDGKTGRREAGVAHHRGSLSPDDVEIVNGIPVSAAPRCAVEMTTMAGVEAGLVSVNGLLASGQLTEAELSDEVERLKFWPDTLTTTVVQRLADPRIQSAAESRTLFLCWAQRLPRPEPQVGVLDEWGHVFAYADFLWRREGVFLEFDGRIKYERFRREGETLEQYLLREKRREELICQLTGWVCIRITWEDLASPRRTAQRIRRILDSRRRWLGAGG